MIQAPGGVFPRVPPSEIPSADSPSAQLDDIEPTNASCALAHVHLAYLNGIFVVGRL